jgi:hypothetical protein
VRGATSVAAVRFRRKATRMAPSPDIPAAASKRAPIPARSRRTPRRWRAPCAWSRLPRRDTARCAILSTAMDAAARIGGCRSPEIAGFGRKKPADLRPRSPPDRSLSRSISSGRIPFIRRFDDFPPVGSANLVDSPAFPLTRLQAAIAVPSVSETSAISGGRQRPSAAADKTRVQRTILSRL